MLLSMQDVLFYLFSLLAIASAFVVVTTPNPIHAILFLVASFAASGSLLVLFGAEYLGVTLDSALSWTTVQVHFSPVYCRQ